MTSESWRNLLYCVHCSAACIKSTFTSCPYRSTDTCVKVHCSRSFWSSGHSDHALTRQWLALRVTSASPRNRSFTPLGFYWIPASCLDSVYHPVRAVDQFNHWLNLIWHPLMYRCSLKVYYIPSLQRTTETSPYILYLTDQRQLTLTNELLCAFLKLTFQWQHLFSFCTKKIWNFFTGEKKS